MLENVSEELVFGFDRLEGLGFENVLEQLHIDFKYRRRVFIAFGSRRQGTI